MLIIFKILIYSTWGIIYTWQALWLVFNVVIIFVRDHQGDRFYNKPAVLTPLFHLFIFINFVLNTIWLILWDRFEFTIGFFVIFFMTASLYAAIVISHRNTYNAQLSAYKFKWILWCYRILVNNGLAFYATWITTATTLNLAIAITYNWTDAADRDFWRSTSGVIGLSIITAVNAIQFLFPIYLFNFIFKTKDSASLFRYGHLCV